MAVMMVMIGAAAAAPATAAIGLGAKCAALVALLGAQLSHMCQAELHLCMCVCGWLTNVPVCILACMYARRLFGARASRVALAL